MQAFPKLREDVIRGSDSSIAQVAKDCGVSPSCLKRGLVDGRGSSGRSRSTGSAGQSDELREANKRIRLLEQENEVLRRACVFPWPAATPARGCVGMSSRCAPCCEHGIKIFRVDLVRVGQRQAHSPRAA